MILLSGHSPLYYTIYYIILFLNYQTYALQVNIELTPVCSCDLNNTSPTYVNQFVKRIKRKYKIASLKNR